MLKPIIVDQYVAARVYFGCVVAIFFLEGITRNVLLLLSKLRSKLLSQLHPLTSGN